MRPYPNFPRVIYVSNVPRTILCSSVLLIGDLSVSPKYLYHQYNSYIENCIHIGRILPPPVVIYVIYGRSLCILCVTLTYIPPSFPFVSILCMTHNKTLLTIQNILFDTQLCYVIIGQDQKSYGG